MADADYFRECLRVPGCQIVIRADREVRSADGVILSCESRYFTTSLSPDKASYAELFDYFHGHWEVENRLPFIKDRWWHEDRHYTKRPRLAEAFASLTNAALTVLRFLCPPDRPLRAAAGPLRRERFDPRAARREPAAAAAIASGRAEA